MVKLGSVILINNVSSFTFNIKNSVLAKGLSSPIF